MVVGEDAGGAQGVQRALFGPMVLTEENDAVRFGAGDVGMTGQIGLSSTFWTDDFSTVNFTPGEGSNSYLDGRS